MSVVRRDVIVVGASAGGVEALRTLIGQLPAGLPAAVLVVLHTPSSGSSVLPRILARAGALPVRFPQGREPLRPGTVLVAPPDHHLVVDDGTVTLSRGPRENGVRPAVDVLFRTAAVDAGPRVIGVVLSGALDDGTAGLAAVVGQGGTAVVQDPDDALYPGMPASALRSVAVQHVVPVARMAGLLVRLCSEPITPGKRTVPPTLQVEADMAQLDGPVLHRADRPGRPSGFSCPDCNGVLWEIGAEEPLRFRCRVGHAWTAESLIGHQGEQLDSALWLALRSLEEKAALARTLSDRARERGNSMTAQRYLDQADTALRSSRLRNRVRRPGRGGGRRR